MCTVFAVLARARLTSSVSDDDGCRRLCRRSGGSEGGTAEGLGSDAKTVNDLWDPLVRALQLALRRKPLASSPQSPQKA